MNVDVYFNLHKKLLSVKDRKTGRVVAHEDLVIIKNPKFVVSEAGRQRVLREKRKNVHAFVRGERVGMDGPIDLPLMAKEVTYNPYKYSSFVLRDSKEAIREADFAIVEGKNITAFFQKER